jgi:hypothetical protein
MYRHVRQTCKIANSEEGMEKLLEHTLRRQLAEVQAQVAAQSGQLAELTSLLKSQILAKLPNVQLLEANPEAQMPSLAINTGHVQNNMTINTTTVNNTTNIILRPWDGRQRLVVPVEAIQKFAETPKFQEYVTLGYEKQMDQRIAAPYVTSLYVDMVKQGHADPAARNIYLNPQRADQALVYMQDGRWQALPLNEATPLLFDKVGETIRKDVLHLSAPRQIESATQGSLIMAGSMYNENQEAYVKLAKAPMAAHLANLTPPKKPLSEITPAAAK